VSRTCIIARIETALEKMRWQRAAVRAIYLTEPDHAALSKALSKRWAKEQDWPGFTGSFLSFGDHEIRRGKTSAIYSTHGVAFTIPKRLSPRTETKAAA
jgi:hypothetical protein